MINECFMYWLEPAPFKEGNIPLRVEVSSQGQALLYKISIFLFFDYISVLATPHSIQAK